MLRSKYNVSSKEKRTYNGIVYDSKREMERAIELEMLESLGKIFDLRRQVKFTLLEKFTDSAGNKQRAIIYICDFMYRQNDEIIVEDVKSKITAKLPEYRMKKKLFLWKFPQFIFYENIR